jgi:hypothetical protein
MSRFRRFTVALICLAGTLGTPAARADMLPVNACDTEGAPCDNVGGAGADQLGVCSVATCSRATGLGDQGGAGGDGVIHYECLRCEPVAGGTGGASPDAAGAAGAMSAIGGATVALGGNAGEAETGGAGAVTGAGGTPAKPHDDGDDGDCGCSFKSLGSERSAVVLMLAVGAAALRRRRRAA